MSSLAPFLSPAKYVHAHRVAVAQHTHVLEEFISRLLKQKALNVTKLASMDMPAGRGKKPKHKASSKQSSKRVKLKGPPSRTHTESNCSDSLQN